MDTRLVVLGAGSWGLALSRLLGNKNYSVNLWDIDQEAITFLQQNHRHPRLLPGIELPNNVHPIHSLEEALNNAHYAIITVPSHAVRSLCKQLKPLISNDLTLINCAKGLDIESLQTMSEVIHDVLPDHSLDRIVVLSGPSHAEEVSRDIPTTVTISGNKLDHIQEIQDIFSTAQFRVYTNPDIIGVEMGGSLKNVIAIAAGACDGMGFGDNTKAALITRGLAEITRLGVKRGGNPATFSGLSGLGDLIVTCMSQHSRNRKFGELRAKGYTTEEALKEIGMVVEGLNTTDSGKRLADKLNVEMPIINEIYQVIYNNKPVEKAVLDLMTRNPKSENEIYA